MHGDGDSPHATDDTLHIGSRNTPGSNHGDAVRILFLKGPYLAIHDRLPRSRTRQTAVRSE
jgi:hypothetical protein